MDLMPYAGEHKPLTIVSDVDWIAPHLMNTLVGTIVEFGYVPERSAKVLNALVDPMRNRRLALHVGFVVLINLVMWLMFCIDYVHAQIGDEPGPEPAEEDPSLDNATDSGGADSVGNSTGTSNSTADSNSTGLVEWDYPQQQFPLFMRGVYPRRPMGLKGIPAMPFLHYHAAQLGVNTVGFILFGTILVLKHGVTIYATLSLWLWFFAGCARTAPAARRCRAPWPSNGLHGFGAPFLPGRLRLTRPCLSCRPPLRPCSVGTWVIGHDANHIGCSGMIFGYFAYIMMIGLLKLLGCPPSCRDVVCTWDSTQDILIAVAMIALYTGILYGALPNATIVGTDGSAISAVVNTWEIDLMGWLGGTLYAAVLAVYLRKTRAFKKVRTPSSCSGTARSMLAGGDGSRSGTDRSDLCAPPRFVAPRVSPHRATETGRLPGSASPRRQRAARWARRWAPAHSPTLGARTTRLATTRGRAKGLAVATITRSSRTSRRPKRYQCRKCLPCTSLSLNSRRTTRSFPLARLALRSCHQT